MKNLKQCSWTLCILSTVLIRSGLIFLEEWRTIHTSVSLRVYIRVSKKFPNTVHHLLSSEIYVLVRQARSANISQMFTFILIDLTTRSLFRFSLSWSIFLAQAISVQGSRCCDLPIALCVYHWQFGTWVDHGRFRWGAVGPSISWSPQVVSNGSIRAVCQSGWGPPRPLHTQQSGEWPHRIHSACQSSHPQTSRGARHSSSFVAGSDCSRTGRTWQLLCRSRGWWLQFYRFGVLLGWNGRHRWWWSCGMGCNASHGLDRVDWNEAILENRDSSGQFIWPRVHCWRGQWSWRWCFEDQCFCCSATKSPILLHPMTIQVASGEAVPFCGRGWNSHRRLRLVGIGQRWGGGGGHSRGSVGNPAPPVGVVRAAFSKWTRSSGEDYSTKANGST